MTTFKKVELEAALDTLRFLNTIDYVTDFSNIFFVQKLSVKVQANQIVATYSKDGVCESFTHSFNKQDLIDYIEVYNKEKEPTAYQGITFIIPALKAGIMILEGKVKGTTSGKVGNAA